MSNLLLTDLPVEIFEEIFSYVGYDEAAKLRLVRDILKYFKSGVVETNSLVLFERFHHK